MKSATDAEQAPDRLIRENEIRRLTGLSRTHRQRLERAGLFPARVTLSERAFGWVESEVRAWIANRISVRDQSRAVIAHVPEMNAADRAA